MADSPTAAPASTQPRAGAGWLPKVALGLGVVALLLAIVPWVGLAAALTALAVSVVAWRRTLAERDRRPPVHPADGAVEPVSHGVGLSQAATGLALSVLAITLVWSLVATLVPKQERPTLDCSRPDLAPADRIQCDEVMP